MRQVVHHLLSGRCPISVARLLIIAFAGTTTTRVHSHVKATLVGTLSRARSPHIRQRLTLLPSTRVSALRTFYRRIVHGCFCAVSLSPTFSVTNRRRLGLLQHRILRSIFLSCCRSSRGTSILCPLTSVFNDSHNSSILVSAIDHVCACTHDVT